MQVGDPVQGTFRTQISQWDSSCSEEENYHGGKPCVFPKLIHFFSLYGNQSWNMNMNKESEITIQRYSLEKQEDVFT